MTPEEYIKQHTIAVDYKGKETVPMLHIENVYEACELAKKLAERNLAKELLDLHESARVELLERLTNQN